MDALHALSRRQKVYSTAEARSVAMFRQNRDPSITQQHFLFVLMLQQGCPHLGRLIVIWWRLTLLALRMERHLPGAQNFEVAFRFLEHLWTPTVSTRLSCICFCKLQL
jgi:hypothetical protein